MKQTKIYEMHLKIKVDYNGEEIDECEIETNVVNEDIPLDVSAIAIEQLMTIISLKSGMDFEETLKMLCEGARKNKILSFDGKQVI